MFQSVVTKGRNILIMVNKSMGQLLEPRRGLSVIGTSRSRFADFRSDTVTQPSEAMREAMALAAVNP